MTSTNDGKDVNCKQSSGPKGKLYFIELYKFLDCRLSEEGGLQERTQHLCQAWQCIHSLCLQSSPKLHLHLLGWLQTHTSRTILHTEWQKPETLPQHAKLVEAIDLHIKECKDSIAKRNGSSLFWEIHLLKRAEWFKKVLSNPWGHPILKKLSNPTEEKPSDKEVIEWLRQERSEMFVSRLRQLAMSKACADIAASLTTAVMDRARASAAAQDQDKDKMDKNEPTFADTLSREAGFNSEVWDLLTDLEFVLLFKGDNPSRCIELAKQRSLRSGYKLVERLLGRVDKLPREKKLWKNAKKVAELIAQVTITRCMVLPSCAGVVYDALYRCARSLAALLPPAALPRAASALAAPAATAAHLHTLATAVAEKCKDEMKAFVCELYVRAITTGMNELERLKLKTEKASEARSTEQMLSTWFTQLGSLLSKSPRLNYECALTAFSVHPSPAMYERIVAAPALPPLATNTESREASADTNSEFGSWATDSRTTTNFVKTSETLNIKQIQNNANVLSTAVLTEGEAIGLGADLCQDLAVLLSGPRHKILSWDISRDVLLENCRTYMERTDGGTRALTTELKYLNLDPRSFQHLPFEKDDEDNIYYGIEKGYEHLVEHEEAEGENEWRAVLFNSETEDAVSSCMDDTDSSPVRRKKKKSKRLDSTDDEVDPLSLSDDQQHQKKKERPHSKERLKSKMRTSSKNKGSADKSMSEKKEQKGERKERKKKDKASTGSEPAVPLSRLIGMKVTRVETQEKQCGEQNQNRKLSITSLNSDSSETNVVFDGLYSMDDISSPEKTHRNQAIFNKTNNLYADLDEDNKPLSQVFNEFSTNNQNKRHEIRLNTVTAAPQTKYTVLQGPSTNTNYKDITAQQDNTAVKQSIKKLIEVRRLKSDSIQPNTTSQFQSSNKSLHSPRHIVPASNVPSGDIKEPCPVPSNTSPHLTPNTSLNDVNIKQFEHMSPSTSEVRSILNGNSVTSNSSGKLYVGRIVFGLAKYTSSLNEQKIKDNDTQRKPKSVSPTPKPESRNVYKIYSKRPPDKEKRIAQKQVLVRNQPQPQCEKLKNVNETKTEYNNLVNQLHSQPCDKLNVANTVATNYKNSMNELQPQQQCDKMKSTNETKPNYKNFVDELKATINAGTIDDELYKESTFQKDRIVPTSKTFSTPNQTKLKAYSPPTPQCAKSFVHQKINEAPNTFARLNYMHKNKQSYIRPKPPSGVKHVQERELTSKLDKQIVDHKLDKFHYLQNRDLTISRVGTGINNRQSKDTSNPLILRRKQGRAPLVVQNTEVDTPFTTQQIVTNNSPNLTKDEYGKIPTKIKTETTEETSAIKNSVKCQMHDVAETTKSSMLKEKDQQDILSLLRQQNKLNAQNPIPDLKFKHIAQISPQCKSENRSINNSVIANTRDLDGAEIQRLFDCENKSILHENTDSLTKTLNLPRDQTQPSIIKIPKSGSKTIYTSHSTSKSEGTNTVASTRNDVNFSSKMPVKRERHTQKKIQPDIETKSDWKLVMQDLLKHKTPSRGPNALDVALNKDSFQKHATNSVINDDMAVEKTKVNVPENTTTQGSNVDYKKVIPSDSITRTAVSSVPMSAIHSHLPKRLSKPDIIQKTDMYYVPKTPLPDIPKNTCDDGNNHNPFVSALPNSDYDILEELMDDDLRQEIGELISDDESIHYPNVTDKKEGQCSFESKGHTIIVTPLQKSIYDNTQRALQTHEMQTNYTAALHQDHAFATSNVTRNVTNNNLVQFPQSTSSLAFSSRGQGYSNREIETVRMTHPNNVIPNMEYPDIKVNTNASNISPFVELNTSRSNNHVYLKRDNNLHSRNDHFTSIPQRTLLQNVVVIGSENVYDTRHIQENQNRGRNLNPNAYITVNNMPNISFLPATTYAAPSVSQVVFGNTLTQNNMQHTLPSSIPPVKYSCEQNFNVPKQFNHFVENTTQTDSKNKITLKTVSSSPDVILEHHKDLILDKESNQLPQTLVGDNLSNTKDDKLFPKVKSLVDINTKMLSSKENERLKQKRMTLIHREVRCYSNLSPIPLPYMSLKKDETKSVGPNDSKEDIGLNVKDPEKDVITRSENLSKTESLENCKINEDAIDAESKELKKKRKNKCTYILRRNHSLPSPNDPGDKEEIVLKKKSKTKNKKGKLKIKNPPLKGTSTLKHKILKSKVTKSFNKNLKVRRSRGSRNICYGQDNSIEPTRPQKLEENVEIENSFEINGNILKESDTVPSVNEFSIEKEYFDIEDELIGSVISKSKLTEPVKDTDVSEPQALSTAIHGKGEEKENDLNKSQKVNDDKQEVSNIKSDTEPVETSIKNSFNEEKSSTDVDSTKMYIAKSVPRRLHVKRNTIKTLQKEITDERNALKKVASDESLKNKFNENKLSIQQTVDVVSKTSGPRIKWTNNLLPVNRNDDMSANCNFQSQETTNESSVHKKRNKKMYNGLKDLTQDLNKVIFEEITSKKSKSIAHKTFRVVLPNGTKFKAVITGKKNYDINNLIVDSEIKCLLLNNFFNNKMTSSTKVHQKQSIRFPASPKITSENTNELETIDLISDDEIDSGFTLETDTGSFLIRSLEKEDFEKHQNKLSSRCFVSLIRYSEEELIAFNGNVKDVESCSIEKSSCLPSRDEQFQNNQSAESEHLTKIPPLNDENIPDVTHLDNGCIKDNAPNETQTDLVSDKTNMEYTADEIQNVPNTLIMNEKVHDGILICKSPDEQKQDFHGALRTQSDTINFNCFIKLTRCDNLVKKYEALKQKCYVELVKCDDVSIDNIMAGQSPHVLEEETVTVVVPLSYNETDSSNEDSNQDNAEDYKTNDDLIYPIIEVDEEKYESKLERSTSCSILTDFFKCREVMDYPMFDKGFNNPNDEQEKFVKTRVYFKVTCYAEWSITKRDMFLQTIKSIECIRQDPDLFHADCSNYTKYSSCSKVDIDTGNDISTLETHPTFQVLSLSKLTIKFFESHSVFDTDKGNHLLKRKLSNEYKLSTNKIFKHKHYAVTDDNEVLNSILKPDTANVFDNTKLAKNISVNENDSCENAGTELDNSQIENFIITTISDSNIIQSNEDSINICANKGNELPSSKNRNVANRKLTDQKSNELTFYKDAEVKSEVQQDIESNKYENLNDLSDDVNGLSKTELKQTDVCNDDDNTKLETTPNSNSNSNINKSKDLCDRSQIKEEKDTDIVHNHSINIEHNYATPNKDDTDELKNLSSTNSLNENGNLEIPNEESNETINLSSEEQNIATESIQDVVLGDIRDDDVAKEQVFENTYDVLRNVTLVYQDNAEIVLKGIEYEDPIAGTCYMFPLESSTVFSEVSNEGDYFCDDEETDDDKMQDKSGTSMDLLTEESFSIIPPKRTYSTYEKDKKSHCFNKSSNRGVKRKGTLDYKMCEKRYRKSKNIDYLKASIDTQMNTAYGKEYKRLLHYYSSIKFSYTRPFDKEHIDAPNLLHNWPIKEIHNVPLCTTESSDIFKDNSEEPRYPDPLKLTLVEEISSDYSECPITSDDTSETNFNMGFGEESGRVIQNLEKKDNILKFSAATLSDVKQTQPFLMSKEYVDSENSIEVSNSSVDNQNIKIKPCTDYIQLKNKVRSYFKKTAMELNYQWTRENLKDKDLMWNFNGDCNLKNCLVDFYMNDFIEPSPIEAIVQVVQIGQLPVSAAAQNPVTCDPRVTQVANASPPQCSEENSSHDDSQSPMKTEYTELTTADLTLPLVAEYNRHDCHKATESQEPAHLHNNQDILQSEFGYCAKMDSKEDYNHDEVKDLSLRNKDVQMLENEDTNHSVYQYDSNVDNNCQELDTQATFFGSTNKENNITERTDQIAHAMNAAGITTTLDDNSKAHTFVNILSEKMHQSNAEPPQNHVNNCSNTASINAVALQQALAQILPPPLNQTTSQETDSQTPSITPQVLHIVQGKNSEGNQIPLVDNVQQSVINTPNAGPVLHIVQNKGPNTNASCNGTPIQQTNSFGALSLVETGLQQSGNQLLHIVNTGNQKDNNANQLLKRVNLLTNLTNVQGSNEQKMLQFVCKSSDGKAIQLNAPHQGSMVLRLQPIENQSEGPSNPEQLSPTPAVTSNAPVHENINTQQEIKSRSIYEENYAKFIQNTSSKQTSPEKATSLPKFNQAFGKPVFQEENQKDNEINSNDSHLPPVNSADDGPETSDSGMNLDQIGQISSPPLLLRKSPQASQAQPSLVQQIKHSITPMNIQTMHGGVIYTRQIPVNIGGGQTINLITVPSTELMDDPNHKQPDVKFVNQGDVVEPSIIKIVPQTTPNSDLSPDETNHNTGSLNENGQNTHPPPVLTQMRIKLPMLSKTPQMVSGTRVVRPSFFQIQRNVIGGANQPVYQQLVLTTAPPLGQQTIRLPQSPMTRQIKVPSESSPESQLSSSTLEQLREFDMVLEQVKERSTVQPNSTANSSISKPHTTTSSDATDGASTVPPPAEPPQSLYSVGANQQFNVAYVNRKSTVTTPTTSTFVRSPDSSVIESPTSSNHVQVSQTVTSATTSNSTSVQQSNPKSGKISSRSRPRPKTSSNPPNTLKLNNVPPKPSTQKPLEDEQTTQRILYILAEYREQVENCPDKNKPAPRRRTNPPSNPGSSKRKKSSSGSRRSGARDSSPINGDDANRTMGSEDSSCGTSQGDCNENCLETPSPQDSPRKVPRKLSFENETPPPQPRPQLQRNVIVADGQTIAVARGPTGKPATAVLMPANYILPVSMLKSGQQIAIVTNRGPKLLTVSGGEGGATGALLLQRLIGPAGLKPMLARPGVRHVRLPAAALHNLHAFNFATATTLQPPDSTMSPASASTPPDLVETRAAASPWTEKSQDVKPERSPSPDGSEPWNVPTSANTHEYTYEETVRTDNLDRTVLDPIPDRYSPDMEAQRIFDKMFDVDAKRSYVVDTQDDSPRCGYDIDTSDCDDKCYHQVVQKRDISSHRQHRLTHVTAAALRHKYAILEHELRLQKSLSEECEDLGVDSPSASELFPEAELLFAGSPAQDHTQDQHPHRPHTPPPIIINQSVPRPDMDDQIATDHLLQRPDLQEDTNRDLAMNLGLDDVGIVTVTESGATITLDHEEFARSHPNTTFHKEPTEEAEMHPYTISGIKSRHITSTIFHASRAPATVLMGPQTTVISQASHDSPHIQHNIRYTHMDNIINAPLAQQHNLNLSTVLVKDDGLTRYDSILTDSRELHLSNTASAIVHSVGNATQVIRRVGYDDDKRDPRFLIDDHDTLIAGDDAKMMGEDSSREALESMSGDVDYDRSSPERQTELYWESNSVADHPESRRPMDFSSDSEKCCRSPPYEENNSTDSSGMSTQVRLDSVIKDARGIDRSGSADGSSADDAHPPLRTYPAKRVYHHPADREAGRSLSGKTRAGERLDSLDVRRRASGRGVVKRCCHCCSGSPLPPRPKKPKPRKPALDYSMH